MQNNFKNNFTRNSILPPTVYNIAKEQQQDIYVKEYFSNHTSGYSPVIMDDVELGTTNNKL